MLSIQHKKNYLEQKTTTTNKQEINLQEANTPYIKIHTKLDLKNLSIFTMEAEPLSHNSIITCLDNSF